MPIQAFTAYSSILLKPKARTGHYKHRRHTAKWCHRDWVSYLYMNAYDLDIYRNIHINNFNYVWILHFTTIQNIDNQISFLGQKCVNKICLWHCRICLGSKIHIFQRKTCWVRKDLQRCNRKTWSVSVDLFLHTDFRIILNDFYVIVKQAVRAGN